MSKKQRMPLNEFLKQFGTEAECRDYLAAQRWPDGFVCPKCGHKHGCRLSNGLYQCTHCHQQTSVTAGTILHHSHVSLSKWFPSFYLISQDKQCQSIYLRYLSCLTQGASSAILGREFAFRFSRRPFSGLLVTA